MASDAAKHRPTVGLLIPHTYQWLTQRFLDGTEKAAQQRGANLVCLVGNSLQDPPHPGNVIYSLVGREALDCLIVWSAFLGSEVGAEYVHRLCESYGGMPIVSLEVPNPALPVIELDYQQSIRDLVDHLVDVHHRRRLAFVGPHQVHEISRIECRILSEELAERGLVLKPEHIMYVNDVPSAGDRCADQTHTEAPSRSSATTASSRALGMLLDERNLIPGVDFDAVITSCATASISVLQCLKERNIQVPDQVSVVGFTDNEVTKALDPPLTVEQTPWAEMADRAVEAALHLADGNTIESRMLVAHKLVIRESCGCISPLVREAQVVLPNAGAVCPVGEILSRLADSRQDVLDDVGCIHAGDTRAESVPVEQVVPVFDALVVALSEAHSQATTHDDVFLHVLTQALRPKEEVEVDVGAWHRILSVLRGRVLPLVVGDARLVQSAEELFQQARTIIGEATMRAQIRERLRAEHVAGEIRQVGAALAIASSVDDVVDALAMWLPRLGIRSCYLSTYLDPGSPATRAQLVFAYRDGRRIDLGEAAGLFPSRQLVPREALPRSRYSLVAYPLYIGDEQLGFVLFDAHPKHNALYEALRVKISSALKSALLHQQAADARAEAEEANRLKSVFLSVVSHELRTPLSIIVARTEMLLKDLSAYRHVLPETTYNELDIIKVTSRQLDHLLGDVLDLGLGQVGRLKLSPIPFPLSRVINPAASAGERMARGKGLSWQAKLPPQMPWVNGDAARLREVMLNLISNAVKFTDSGDVELRVTGSSGQVTISVSDTGVGIPSGECERIFDEFWQSSRTAGKRAFGGIGLGLAISRRLVEMHGGRIWAESPANLGHGTTFHFTLPTIPRPTLETVDSDDQRPVLLMTDGDGHDRRVHKYLEERGFIVEDLRVADVEDWEKRPVLSSPAAVVLDMEPATRRGWDLVRMFKAHPRTCDVPIVFYSLLEQQASGSVLTLDYLTPATDQESLAQALARQGVTTDASHTCTVLVVDDSPMVVDWNTQLVRQRLPHCRVLSAPNGKEALAMMAQERPDLVLLDLMMPEMDGFAVLEAMRERLELVDVPVIVMTGHDLLPDAMERLNCGVTSVLMKGMLSPEETLEQVESAISRSKRLRGDTQHQVRKAMAYIHEHYDQPISRQDIARYVSVSEAYLSKCFRQETGVTLVGYINRYRVKKAKALLEKGDMSVTQVALDVGFSSQAYFSRVFQREVGVSPSAYQQGKRPSR